MDRYPLLATLCWGIAAIFISIFIVVMIADKEVLTCIDGDTFQQGETYYRLSFMDTPEKGETNYTKASEYTCNFLNNNKINLDEKGLDKYGRTLVEVTDSKGFSLNYLLVENCLAEPFYGKTTEEILNIHNLNCK